MCAKHGRTRGHQYAQDLPGGLQGVAYVVCEADLLGETDPHASQQRERQPDEATPPNFLRS
jgi:hypothetical protein